MVPMQLAIFMFISSCSLKRKGTPIESIMPLLRRLICHVQNIIFFTTYLPRRDLGRFRYDQQVYYTGRLTAVSRVRGWSVRTALYVCLCVTHAYRDKHNMSSLLYKHCKHTLCCNMNTVYWYISGYCNAKQLMYVQIGCAFLKICITIMHFFL